jgi:L-ascorbate metabolism protein UlaG (beta-lactamase superfamily)
MKVTYIHHSSFCVEIEDCVFLFDYFEGDIPQFDDSKKIFVLSSHMHQDHFDFKIFELGKQYSHVNYILSKDIKDKYNRKYMEKGVFLTRL